MSAATWKLSTVAMEHVVALCSVQPDRRPGSTGNHEATAYVEGVFTAFGWTVLLQDFECLDWDSEGGVIEFGGRAIELTPSPYCRGVAGAGPLRIVDTIGDLDRPDLAGTIVVLTGDVAGAPLTPKGYPFYASERDADIIERLEQAGPLAVIGVTGKHPALCGALDPFPLIEDGEFTVATANLRADDAAPLLAADGATASIRIDATRVPARARNVVATRGHRTRRVTIIAHVDTKPGTPGAVDNAAGVAVLLLLAELLGPSRHPELAVGVELLAVNGEDHYAAPGELAWLASQDDLADVVLAVNIDGAGFKGGGTHFSTYNLGHALTQHIAGVLEGSSGIREGPEWYQSDHAILAMRGRPALAFTSADLDRLLAEVYHSPADTPDVVASDRVVEIAEALETLVTTWPA